METGIGAGAPDAEVHTGDCCAIGNRTWPIAREQAVAALTGGIRTCGPCRPDTVLGLLD
ncbi:DUF6233 domain-containing protein [Streptomyces sanglieri]|uniref:DUF6233 domain-containing protein n=1 Tax=Streptomyces sanglieri TaxID=193460 RepID=UPI0035252E2C